MPKFAVDVVHRTSGKTDQLTIEAADEYGAMRMVGQEYVIGQVHKVYQRPPAKPIEPCQSRLLTHPRQTIATGVALGMAYVVAVLFVVFVIVRLVQMNG